jgi:hypothetical protein
MYSTWNAMARFIKSGEFDPSPVVTHRFPLEGIATGGGGHQGRPGREGDPGDRHMSNELTTRLGAELEQFRQDGVYKRLNYLEGPRDRAPGWKVAATS